MKSTVLDHSLNSHVNPLNAFIVLIRRSIRCHPIGVLAWTPNADDIVNKLTEVWHMAHFWVSYGRCTMPGSPMGRLVGLSRRWAG